MSKVSGFARSIQAEQMKSQSSRAMRYVHRPPSLSQVNVARLPMSSLSAGLQAVGLSAYTTSKYAGIGLTKEAAIAYGRYGIRVNALCPGLVETPMSDGFVNDVNRARHAAAFALGRASHHGRAGKCHQFLAQR